MVGVHGQDVGGDGDPEVGGERDGGGAEKVEVLGHVGVAHLGREFVIDEITPTEAGLEAGVEFTLYLEAGKVKAEVDFETVVDAPVVFDVGHHFVSAHGALPNDGVEFVGVVEFFQTGGFGGKVVEGVAGAEFDGVVGGWGVVEVGTGHNVLNAGFETEGKGLRPVVDAVYLFCGDSEVAAVAGVGAGDVHEEFWREFVVPAQTSHDVAPAIFEPHIFFVHVSVGHFETCVEGVVAHVVGGVETAAVVEAVGDFGVEVVEIVSAVEFSVFAFFTHYQCENGLQENVAVGAPGRDGEGGPLFDYWAFDVGFGRDEPYADTAVVFFVVAVVGGDVEDGRKAAAETCGEAALVKLYVLHGIGVEGREEAAEVVDVVHGYAVEEEEVLVGSTATDIHACSAFTAVLDAGEELDGLDDIGFTE